MPERSEDHRADHDSDDAVGVPARDNSPLDAAAAQGPLEGVAAEDAAQARGEDNSGDNESSTTGTGVLNKLLPRYDS